LSDTLLSTSAAWCLDIQAPHTKYTSCFTKSYGRYIKGTGSVLLCVEEGTTDNTEKMEQEVLAYIHQQNTTNTNDGDQKRQYDSHWWSQVQAQFPDVNIKLRYFTPRELLRLFGFPETFHFAILPHPIKTNSKDTAFTNKHKKARLMADAPKEEEEEEVAQPVTIRKQYELIGNSINVTVVSHLLAYLLSFPEKQE